MSQQIFKIRPYEKHELATLYFPLSPNRAAATRNLYNLMNRNKELMQQLHRMGYTTHNRVFTAAQIRVIVHYLCEP